MQAVADLQLVELIGRGAHDLEDDGHAPGLGVGVGYRQGNALAGLVHAQDDELPRLRLARDEGRRNVHPRDGGVERFFLQNGVHGTSFPSVAVAGDAKRCRFLSRIREFLAEMNEAFFRQSRTMITQRAQKEKEFSKTFSNGETAALLPWEKGERSGFLRDALSGGGFPVLRKCRPSSCPGRPAEPSGDTSGPQPRSGPPRRCGSWRR